MRDTERGPVTAARGPQLVTDHDVFLFKEGTHYRLFDKLGAHLGAEDGAAGVRFAVWAPNAERVSVIGDFNEWSPGTTPLEPRADGSGIWQGFVAGVAEGAAYKYRIASRFGGYEVDKGDPFAFGWQEPPRTASRVRSLDYDWSDGDWMRDRAARPSLDRPWSIYEVHLGSWMRDPARTDRLLGYCEIAPRLAEYVSDCGFTHVELMPVMEHPFYGSWGYQVTGYFAPTARYGTPQDFMYLVDHLHQRGIGVVLDWVPSHFPDDEHGLSYFDGTHLFEHADPRQGFHPDWNSYVFNYGRNEVRAFLASSAHYWIDVYHADGLRVDAVSSMLYLNYGRKPGEWVPNRHGGHENLDAVAFLRELNRSVYAEHPGVEMIAEESTAWPMVSRPVYLGGLGFGMKWNMGWMHDTLGYLGQDPLFRRYRHAQLTFSIWYAFAENFVLSLSHDEVVYGKGSLIRKMPGDDWQRFANLRLLFGYQYAHPGKKLLFMGGEFGQWSEWNHDAGLDWHLLDRAPHAGLRRWVEDLNRFYRDDPALWRRDFDRAGFEWIDCHDAEGSVIAFARKDDAGGMTLVACNFTPVVRRDYRLGVPRPGRWREALNSDAAIYGGGGVGNLGEARTEPVPSHGRDQSLRLTLPPLAVLFFTAEPDADLDAGGGRTAPAQTERKT